MISLLSFVIVIAICVIVHEGGHYLAAVWRDVQVHEFSFGMGPAIVSKRHNGVLWSIRSFPVGGFVRLEGMEDKPLPEDTPDPTRAFPIRKAWERFAIIAGGPIFNILLAWILTAMLLSFHGVLDTKSPVIGDLMPGFPAAEMGARPGDRVISINGTQITEWREIRECLQKLDVNEVSVIVQRQGENVELNGTVLYSEEYGARLWGIQPSRAKSPLHVAAAKSLHYCWQMSVDIITGLIRMLTGKMEADVTGPVGIAVMAGDAARQGFWTFFSFLAVINLNLGLLNLLPLPALDGGRLVFLFGEMISGRRFPEKWENRVHIVGLALLLALIAFVTMNDIYRIFR